MMVPTDLYGVMLVYYPGANIDKSTDNREFSGDFSAYSRKWMDYPGLIFLAGVIMFFPGLDNLTDL